LDENGRLILMQSDPLLQSDPWNHPWGLL